MIILEKMIKILFLLLTFLLSGNVIFQRNPAVLAEDVPLLAAVPYGDERETVSAEQLRQDYASGKIFVLEKAKPAADIFFKKNNSNIIKSWADFLKLPGNAVVITDLEHLPVQSKVLKVNDLSFFENPEKYPLYQKKDKPFDFKNHISRLMLTGVTAITRGTGRAADSNGAAYLVELVKPYFKGADWVHISNEVSFTDDCSYIAGTKFCTKPAHFQALTELGCNIIELTGNHNRDYGSEAFKKTFDWYNEHHIQAFGGGLNEVSANKPLLIKLKDGKKLGFIGFNEYCPLGECAKGEQPGANRYEKEKARLVLERLRKDLKADFIFASVQFGELDAYYPTSTQKKICRDLLDAGADFVYGSQAHQVQYVEFYQGKPVFYGLGNFLFDQIHKVGVRQGFFLKNYFYKGKLVQAVPVFTMIDKTRRPRPADSTEAAATRREIFKPELLNTF
jgi:poly-gamma-glutamate capsule biosynthesis protein CapA/YwtB (metallophosphatase superfamily)